MNNETVSTLSNEIISEIYLGTIQVYIYVGSYAILIYASLLHFPDEVKYIWKQRFTLPTYLYLLSKYPLFLYFAMILVADNSESLSLCNGLGMLSEALTILSFVGIQGLISVRTYALCQGYHQPVAAIISIMISVYLAFEAYGITIPPCNTTSSLPKILRILDLIVNTVVVLLDVLAFVVVVHRVWGLWKLKRSLSLQSNKDLVTSVLKQGTLRFCFVLFITTAGIFLSFFSPSINEDLTVIQNVLSTLLMCEFTLDLRRRDEKKEIPNPSAINLPTISFRESPVQSIRSAMGRLHESVVAEMGEKSELVPVHRNSSGSRASDGLQNSNHEDDVEVV